MTIDILIYCFCFSKKKTDEQKNKSFRKPKTPLQIVADATGQDTWQTTSPSISIAGSADDRESEASPAPSFTSDTWFDDHRTTVAPVVTSIQIDSPSPNFLSPALSTSATAGSFNSTEYPYFVPGNNQFGKATPVGILQPTLPANIDACMKASMQCISDENIKDALGMLDMYKSAGELQARNAYLLQEQIKVEAEARNHVFQHQQRMHSDSVKSVADVLHEIREMIQCLDNSMQV